jgi:hypothetical protein
MVLESLVAVMDAWLCLLCLESGDQIVTHARLRVAWLLSRVYT